MYFPSLSFLSLLVLSQDFFRKFRKSLNFYIQFYSRNIFNYPRKLCNSIKQSHKSRCFCLCTADSSTKYIESIALNVNFAFSVSTWSFRQRKKKNYSHLFFFFFSRSGVGIMQGNMVFQIDEI